MSDAEFNFVVKRIDHQYGPDWEEDPDSFTGRRAVKHDLNPPLWQVYLPHQCGEWQVAVDSDGYSFKVSQAKAIESLEQFIADAQKALEALRAGQEFGSD